LINTKNSLDKVLSDVGGKLLGEKLRVDSNKEYSGWYNYVIYTDESRIPSFRIRLYKSCKIDLYVYRGTYPALEFEERGEMFGCNYECFPSGNREDLDAIVFDADIESLYDLIISVIPFKKH
jgi:hypothetical protein